MSSDNHREREWLSTASLAVLAIVALGFALSYARSVLVPFVLAVFVFMLVSPLLDIQVLRLRVPRPAAVVIALLIVLIVLTGLSLLVIQAGQTIVSTTGQYTESFTALASEVSMKLESWGFDLGQSEIVRQLQSRIPPLVTGAFGKVFGLLSGGFLVAIFVIFLLAGRDPHVVRKGIYAEIEQKVRRYIVTKASVSVVTGLLVWATLALFKLELANVFGMLAFLLNFIPSIGSVIATLLPIPVAVAQYENPWLIVGVIVVPGVIQNIIGNGIEPKLMGQSMKLHPIVILLALSFWGLLWGIAGMFLAVPITAVIRIVLMQFDTLRPVGEILAGRLPKN